MGAGQPWIPARRRRETDAQHVNPKNGEPHQMLGVLLIKAHTQKKSPKKKAEKGTRCQGLQTKNPHTLHSSNSWGLALNILLLRSSEVTRLLGSKPLKS